MAVPVRDGRGHPPTGRNIRDQGSVPMQVLMSLRLLLA